MGFVNNVTNGDDLMETLNLDEEYLKSGQSLTEINPRFQNLFIPFRANMHRRNS